MKILLICALFLSIGTQAQDKKPEKKKVVRDYGDIQVLQRDACRKPTEALETKYPDQSPDDIKKLKKECPYQAPD